VIALELLDIPRSLREGFYMFWETLWPLVLGFTLSGIVQAFVPRERMQRVMGDHRPASVMRATAFGTVSSSCSYAATAMARSLYRKGADFVTSMIFMFASTNLVLELGIVLVILMGWQFAAAEFVGGVLMVALLALTGGWVMRRITPPRDGDDAPEHVHGAAPAAKPTWADAATYTMADLKMLRRELVIGYVVAGFLVVLVPNTVWNDLFITGHGPWTSIENVLVGPLIAVVSFVCSIGNVPLAAALWSGGISFGGVVSFIFADLITLPLLLIYRKMYGRRVALRLLVWFWCVIAVAGLVVEGLFAATGLVPTHRAIDDHMATIEWNYTTVLNILFLGLFAYVYWLYRNRERLGGGQGYAIDPNCGMQVEMTNAPATAVRDGERYWFCSDRCADKFSAADASDSAKKSSGSGKPSAK
jgi:uncharacterized membrane protein YraQ (UPF0718 family)/YHS domain-containing protein